MPIDLDNNYIDRPGMSCGMLCGSVCNLSETGRSVAGDPLLAAFNTTAMKNVVEERDNQVDTSSSSSIGRNSDSLSDGDGDSVEVEVQSPCKGPLDCLDSLEEVLPVKRAMSKFYCGKSKSFTSLGDTSSCSTIKEIAKPENGFTRKRKNLIAHRTLWDKNCNFPPRPNSGSGISKRPFLSSRSTLVIGMTISSGYENDNNSNNSSDSSNSNSSPPAACPRPLYPDSKRSPISPSSSSPPQRNLPPWRSFSLSDLQCDATSSATPSITGLVINNKGNKDKLQ